MSTASSQRSSEGSIDEQNNGSGTVKATGSTPSCRLLPIREAHSLSCPVFEPQECPYCQRAHQRGIWNQLAPAPLTGASPLGCKGQLMRWHPSRTSG
jgi:hypothetical protein